MPLLKSSDAIIIPTATARSTSTNTVSSSMAIKTAERFRRVAEVLEATVVDDPDAHGDQDPSENRRENPRSTRRLPSRHDSSLPCGSMGGKAIADAADQRDRGDPWRRIQGDHKQPSDFFYIDKAHALHGSLACPRRRRRG